MTIGRVCAYLIARLWRAAPACAPFIGLCYSPISKWRVGRANEKA